MSYVITEKCLGERYATCVEVCPVDCIHPGYLSETERALVHDEGIDVSELGAKLAELREEHPKTEDAEDEVAAHFMVIDPDTCIDCSLCKPECPIDAIVETEDEDLRWAEINKFLALEDEWTSHEPVEPRTRDDAPRRPDVNEIVNP